MLSDLTLFVIYLQNISAQSKLNTALSSQRELLREAFKTDRLPTYPGESPVSNLLSLKLNGGLLYIVTRSYLQWPISSRLLVYLIILSMSKSPLILQSICIKHTTNIYTCHCHFRNYRHWAIF